MCIWWTRVHLAIRSIPQTAKKRRIAATIFDVHVRSSLSSTGNQTIGG